MSTERVESDDLGLARAATVLGQGGVVVIPTDTVYGLAAHPDCPKAVARLYAIKGRAEQKPIALLAADEGAVAHFGYPLGGAALSLAKAHWPGALTLVVSPAEGQGGVAEGFRVPAHPWTRRLLAACGGVLRVTSANLSGRTPATDAVAAFEAVGLRSDLVVDDGPCAGGIPSTVVQVTKEGTLVVLREGALKVQVRCN